MLCCAGSVHWIIVRSVCRLLLKLQVVGQFPRLEQNDRSEIQESQRRVSSPAAEDFTPGAATDCEFHSHWQTFGKQRTTRLTSCCLRKHSCYRRLSPSLSLMLQELAQSASLSVCAASRSLTWICQHVKWTDTVFLFGWRPWKRQLHSNDVTAVICKTLLILHCCR